MPGRIFGIIIVVMGILVILTPWYVFPVCEKGRYAPPDGGSQGYHACYETLKAETVLGAAAVIIGLIPVIRPRRKTLMGVSVIAIGISILIILFPTAITGVCKMPTMPCVTGTLPALVIGGVLMGITGVIALLASNRMQ